MYVLSRSKENFTLLFYYFSSKNCHLLHPQKCVTACASLEMPCSVDFCNAYTLYSLGDNVSVLIKFSLKTSVIISIIINSA